ncbi:MAG TPA: MarR family transcriptional regulator [Acidobacteriota bacterium]|nr:MarR family transcriptional regulator [Acidobacteriota bacterium]
MEKAKIRGFRRNLRRFERLIESQIKDACFCTGVSMAQCHLLLEIEGQGETTAAALSESMGLDKSTLSLTIDCLVGSGLVERREHPVDRRYTLLCLSEQGRKICAEINQVNDEYYESIFQMIPAEKHEEVISCFGLLVDSLIEDDTRRKNQDKCC